MKKLSTLEFISRSNEIHNNKYIYTKTQYKDSKDKVTITCPIHGDFLQIPNAHLRGLGCPKCYGFKKTTEDFIKEAIQVHGNKYDYSRSKYTTNLEKVCIICPEHGEFWLTPNNHISKHRGCPKCNQSHGEAFIELYLRSKNITYIPQYEISIDRSINSSGKARIDFFLPDYNLAIEYNGEQHYKPINHFGGKLKFDKLVLRDKYIEKYCEKHCILLVTIPYSKYETKLRKCLKELLPF